MNHTYKIKSHFWTLVSVPIIIQYDVFWSSSFCSWFSATFSAFQSSLFHANFLYFLPSNQDSCALLPPFSPGSIANPPRAWLGNNFGSGQAAIQTLLTVLGASVVQKGLWDEQFGGGGWCSAYSHPGRWTPSLILKKKPVCPLHSCYTGCPKYSDYKAPGYLRSHFCSPLSNLIKLWFKEDKHKYIKDKWSQKLYCSLLFISKL